MTLSFTVSLRRTFLVLLGIIVVLTIASTASVATAYFFELPAHSYPLVQLFWLDAEANVPTLYATVTLLLSAALLATIAAVRRRQRAPFATHWAVMAVIFLYLGVDEGARIHELAGAPLRAMLQEQGWLQTTFLARSRTWVPIGIPLVVLFVPAYSRFLLALPAGSATS